jgi:hypothetical protein
MFVKREVTRATRLASVSRPLRRRRGLPVGGRRWLGCSKHVGLRGPRVRAHWMTTTLVALGASVWLITTSAARSEHEMRSWSKSPRNHISRVGGPCR